jgi:hypothetical protein
MLRDLLPNFSSFALLGACCELSWGEPLRLVVVDPPCFDDLAHLVEAIELARPAGR